MKRSNKRFRKRYNKKSTINPKLKMAVNRIVKKEIDKNIEDKFIVDIGTDQPNFNGGILDMTPLPTQGTGASQRVGDHIKMKNMFFNYYLTSGGIQEEVRIIVFQYKINTVPVVADILNATYINSVYSPIAPYNMDNYNNKTFTVLYDAYHLMDDNQGPTITRGSRLITNFTKKITYAAGLAIPINNRIYVLYISNTNAGLNNPTFHYVAQTVYEDA